MKDEYLFQTHRFLDGELSDRECEAFEKLMEEQPELAGYVGRVRDLNASLENMPTIRAPHVELPRGIISRFVDLLSVQWRIPAVPVVVTCLLLTAFFLWKGVAGIENPAEHRISDIKFVYFSKTAKSVTVVGSFNGWEQEVQLHPRGENGYWVVELPVSPGEYSYSFIVDGMTRVADPTADSFREDDFGSKNSIFRVGI